MSTQTLLFADQVGSTAQLTTLGDSRAKDVRQRFFDILRDAVLGFNGREVDYTGDGVFATFGSARNAVDAAITLQQLVDSFNRRLPPGEQVAVRVGVHTGDPLDGEGALDVFGTSVVVARRLCDKANAGEILASALTRALVEPHGDHAFRSVGSLELKGIPQATEASLLLWDPVPTTDRRVPPVLDAAEDPVGRERILEWLTAQLGEAVARSGRRLVLLEGVAGIGKTTVLAGFARATIESGAAVLYGRGAGAAQDLAPWIEAVSTWAASQTRAEVRLLAGPDAAVLGQLVPAIADRLVPRAPPSNAPASVEMFRIVEALDGLLSRLAGDAPLVCLLDDLDLADRSSLLALGTLLGPSRPGPILFVACTRPVADGSPATCEQLSLHPWQVAASRRLEGLDLRGVEALLAAGDGTRPDADTVCRIHAESRGIPYVVRQRALELRERRLGSAVSSAAQRAEEVWSDLRQARDELAMGLWELDKLRDEVATAAPADLDSAGTQPAPIECPYQGLARYEVSDAERFFGREQLVAELVARLAASRFVAVVGASGAGKSSLVRAGLLSALAWGGLPGSNRWRGVVMTPGEQPVDALVDLLSDAGPETRPAEHGAPAAAELNATDEPRVARLVLVIDQAEELFTVADEVERARFLDLLCRAVDRPGGPVAAVMVFRSDVYGRTAEHARLAQLVQESQLLVGPMTDDELRRAIERPAAHAGLILESGLAQAVIDDAAHQPGSLPLVAAALQGTFDRRQGRSMTLAGYADAGGVSGALARLAEDTWIQLDDDQRAALRRLLGRLAAPDDRGHELRRIASTAELEADPVASGVLSLLADRRLVTVDGDDVEVAHEALLREWPRLRGWLDSDRQARRFEQRLGSDAAAWDTASRDQELLLRGTRLALAREFVSSLDSSSDGTPQLTRVERDFLEASDEAATAELRGARRSARRLRVLLVAAGVGLAVAIFAGAVAVRQRQEARTLADEATVRGLMSQSQAVADSNREAAALLAVEAYDRAPRADTAGNLLSVLEHDPAFLGYLRQPDDVSFTAATALPDGHLAVGDEQGKVFVFDTTTRQPVATPLQLGAAVTALAVDPADRVLAVGLTGSVQLFDLAEVVAGAAGVRDALTIEGGPNRLVWRPDSGALAVQEPQRTTIWDLQRREVVRTFLGRLSAVAYSEDLLAVGDASTVHLFDAKTLTPVAPPQATVPAATFIAFTAGGDQLVTFDIDGRPALRDVPGLQEVSKSRESLFCTHAMVDGRTVWCAGTLTRRLQGFDVDSWVASPIDFEIQDGAVDVAAGEAGGRAMLAVVLRDVPRVALWSRSGRGAIAGLVAGPGAAPLEYSLDSTKLVTADDSYRVWAMSGSAPAAEPLSRPRQFPADERATALSADGRLFALTSAREVTTQDPATGRRTLVPLPEVGQPIALDVDQAGRRVAIEFQVGDPGRGELAASTQLLEVDVSTGSVLSDHGRAVRSLVGYTAEGGPLVFDGGGAVIDLGAARELLAASPDRRLIVLSPGARYLVDADAAGTVTLRDVADGSPIAPAIATGLAIAAVATDREATVLAVGADDGDVQLFDVRAGQRLGRPLPSSRESTVALRPDGRQIAIAVAQGVEMWDLDWDAWRNAACQRASRNLTSAEWHEYLPGESARATCAAAPAG